MICAPVVAREAREQGKDVAAHHAHLLVHGLLHLQGLDHERDADAVRMERRERAILARLGFADPYSVGVTATPRGGHRGVLIEYSLPSPAPE